MRKNLTQNEPVFRAQSTEHLFTVVLTSQTLRKAARAIRERAIAIAIALSVSSLYAPNVLIANRCLPAPSR